jgi:predicted enzyme related to lactoylglutathione lyase
MDSVVHFEMPYDDRRRMAKFYQSAFGWQTQLLGEDMGNYVLATTGQTRDDGTPTEPGRINGGFYEKKEGYPQQVPSVVIAVDDLKRSSEKVESAGGKVLGDPWDIPGVGRYVSFLDTEGNRVSMLQPARRK